METAGLLAWTKIYGFICLFIIDMLSIVHLFHYTRQFNSDVLIVFGVPKFNFVFMLYLYLRL